MIGIIAAMDCEMNRLETELQNCEKVDIGGSFFYRGIMYDKEVVIALGGIGKTNIAVCTAIMIFVYHCDIVINTGIAGGLSPLKTKDIVLASKLGYFDVDATVFGYKKGQIPQMPHFFTPDDNVLMKVKWSLKNLGLPYEEATILTGDSFVTTKEKIEEFSFNDKIAVEMEGASVAQTCYRFGVPFVSIRFISDIIGAENQIDDYQQFENEMGNLSSSICLEIIKKI